LEADCIMKSAPPPLSWVVFKIYQLCNLNCSYCYVYNRGDFSWKSRPIAVSDEVVECLGARVSQHCKRYDLSRFVIEFHGGEPLLIGKAGFERIIRILRHTCSGIELDLNVQSNGVLLDREWVNFFNKNDVGIGISIDGPALVADRARKFRNGRGSTDRILKNIRELKEHFGDDFRFGVLCVINPVISGHDMMAWFRDQGIDSIDFLLPLGNYANLPENWQGAEDYTKFLRDAYVDWLANSGCPNVRIFEKMMRGHLGRTPNLDALGGDLRTLCVVDTDGGIAVSDVARMCGGRYANDHLNILTHDLDMHAQYFSLAELQEPSAICQSCSEFKACRGGYLPHRFDGVGFDNPSLFCDTLKAVSSDIRKTLMEHLPASTLNVAN
jgi:uncharacterized protein